MPRWVRLLLRDASAVLRPLGGRSVPVRYTHRCAGTDPSILLGSRVDHLPGKTYRAMKAGRLDRHTRANLSFLNPLAQFASVRADTPEPRQMLRVAPLLGGTPAITGPAGVRGGQAYD
jgi:hypothetical protein